MCQWRRRHSRPSPTRRAAPAKLFTAVSVGLYSLWHRPRLTEAAYEKVKLGMPVSEVQKALGEPMDVDWLQKQYGNMPIAGEVLRTDEGAVTNQEETEVTT